jgi:hypothetical protein
MNKQINLKGQQRKEMNYNEPIWHQMKKRNPSSGQDGQLVHWWLLVHFN